MIRAPAEVGSAANSYEVLAKLAMGGMAEIFLARGASAAGVERYVVLKRVLRQRASDGHFVQMFLDEARLAAQLQHPNIAQVYDIGTLGDSYFFTMEYVHGETVRTLLARSHGLRQLIPISSVLSIIAGAAAGLQHAHERKGFDGRHLGIVHRDVSPSNLMVSYEGTVKVVDFGVAKAAHRSTETQSGTVKGKISYMAPEQCTGGDIDRRTDLFSLGIVMWELLTTEKLFRRIGDFETMQAIVHDDVPPPSRLRPEVPAAIDHIVMRLLAKDPAQRYQTADQLHEAIENAAVCTGSALSTASLGRYMRELFGQRPEPWIELQTDHHPERVTVTSEPIPSRLAFPSFQPASAPHPALAGNEAVSYPIAVRSQESRPVAAPRRSRAPIIVIPAVTLGIILGVALALGGGDDDVEPGAAAAVPSTTTTMVAIREPQPAVAVVHAETATVAQPAVAVVHAETATVAHAAETRVEEPAPIAMPDDVIEPASQMAVATPKPDLAGLFKARNYSEVVTACASSQQLARSSSTVCTVAACRTKQAAKAKRWLALVPAEKKAAVLEACNGVLESPSTDDICFRDPLACRH